MRHVLHVIVPPATAPNYDFVTKPFAEEKEKIAAESITLTESTAKEVLIKIFSADSISLWQEL